MKKARAAVFYGQFGIALSFGMWRLAQRLRAIGIEAQNYNYEDVNAADRWVSQGRGVGYLTLLFGYSLGVTSVTDLQRFIPCDLVFCIAASQFAGENNYQINKKNTKRSVLVYSTVDPLSSAGTNLGFDLVERYNAPHLWMDLAGPVSDLALSEAKKAIGA